MTLADTNKLTEETPDSTVAPREVAAQSPLSCLHAPTRAWFTGVFDAPTEVQAGSWPRVAEGQNTLLFAPTGSGKTLAAFLAVLDRILFGPPPVLPEDATTSSVRVLYISPLKALGVDVDRNLRAPLAGIAAVARQQKHPQRPVSVGVRTGDTPSRERAQMARTPPEILITTPESLYLLLTSKARQTLAAVETVIIDEIHALLPTKRGAHLMVSLERLEALRARENPAIGPLQRIGLSATQRPIEEAMQFLGGALPRPIDESMAPTFRPVAVVDARAKPNLDLRVEMPLEQLRAAKNAEGQESAAILLRGGPEDFTDDAADFPDDFNPDTDLAAGNLARGPLPPSIWPAIYPHLIALIEAHRSTIVFVNSRRLAERIAAAINEEVDFELARPHHGSLARDTRQETEDLLKTGKLRAIIATSSLELGIDMGAVDLVVQIEAPASIAAGLQRVGRAGHSVGAVSKGVIYPKYRGDLLAAAAAVASMQEAAIEATRYLRNPLDLLAQQIVAMVAMDDWTVDALYSTLRTAAPFAALPRAAYLETLNLLSGRYPSEDFGELRPRITWDRLEDRLTARKGAQRMAILNGGTIPDRGLFGVFLGGAEGGRPSRVGELDEEMVYELQPGEVFRLGASSWRVLEITRDQVLVDPAPGEPGKMPYWRGEGLGRTLEFGMAIGELARTLASGANAADATRAADRLEREHALAPEAARVLIDYVADQVAATGAAPSDRQLVLERFRDEIGDWRVVLLSPFGARVHAPWAMCAARQLRHKFVDVDVVWTDDGMVFRIPESDNLPELTDFLPDPETLEDAVTEALADTAMFAARFRENAARALLLPRQNPTRRTPLWLQRRKAGDLLKVASRFPSFPVLLETYRECLTDVLDIAGLRQILEWQRTRRLEIVEVETDAPSPFAQTVLFDFTGSFIYETDAPLAERRAEALALDHSQLKELIGSPNYRALLEAEAVDEVALSLARLDRPVLRHADDIHDLLLALGDLSHPEILARLDPQRLSPEALDAALASLAETRRIVPVRLGGQERWVAVEEAARYRDATGCVLPLGLPHSLLDPVPEALDGLIVRYARTHVGFGSGEICARLGVDEDTVLATLAKLTRAGRLLEGEFTPGATHREWIDREVLGQIKRRSLARLRKTIEPVPAARFAEFLADWQYVSRPRRGLDGVLDVIEQLQGLPILASVLERELLPARVSNFHGGMLDELCQSGEVIWQGIEPVGQSDGRLALYLADQFPLLGRATLLGRIAGASQSPGRLSEEPADSAVSLEEAIVALLQERGALTFEEVAARLNRPAPDLVAPLWKAVWGGRISNDALTALRSALKLNQRPTSTGSAGGVGTRRRHRPTRFRSRRRTFIAGTEGRWYALPTPADYVSPTERVEATARQLLERHGVVTRETVAAEGIPGGFSTLYPIFKAMEDAGTVRRGYFIEQHGASQFALPPVVDRLRGSGAGSGGGVGVGAGSGASEGAGAGARAAVGAARNTPGMRVLAATDPANPYGATLAWPTPRHEGSSVRAARAAGARVVLGDGHCLAYMTRGANAIHLFLSADAGRRRAEVAGLADALIGLAGTDGSFMLTEIDGRAIGDIPTSRNMPGHADDDDGAALVQALVAAGADNGYRGLRVAPKPTSGSARA